MKNERCRGTKSEGASVMIRLTTVMNVSTERDVMILPTKTESSANQKHAGMIQMKRRIVNADEKKRNDRIYMITRRVMSLDGREKSITDDTDQIGTTNGGTERGNENHGSGTERRINLPNGSIAVPEMKKIVGRNDEQTGARIAKTGIVENEKEKDTNGRDYDLHGDHERRERNDDDDRRRDNRGYRERRGEKGVSREPDRHRPRGESSRDRERHTSGKDRRSADRREDRHW